MGWLDLTNAPDVYNLPSNASIRRWEGRNFGAKETLTAVNLSSCANLGLPDPEIPETADALERMIDTFLTYSFDRNAAGYATCTIALHANAKARLTDEQKAAITAKGYTIS